MICNPLPIGQIVFSNSNLRSDAKEFIAGAVSIKVAAGRSSLDDAVEAIFAHIRHRYELKLREGQSDITNNEVAGIIARHVLCG
jgi:hypothetical protein